MTWRKWWALEIATGLGTLVLTLPLDYVRFMTNALVVASFGYCYMRRIQAQQASKR